MSMDATNLPRDPEVPWQMRRFFEKPPIALALFLIFGSLPLLALGFASCIHARTAVFFARPSLIESASMILFSMSWGLAPLTAGILLLFLSRYFPKNSTDAERWFDHLLAYDLELLKHRALQKIEMRLPIRGLSPPDADDPTVCEPPCWCVGVPERDDRWRSGADTNPDWKCGYDRQVRCRIYRFSQLFLGERHLACHLCDFNAATGRILWEETFDCHYKDIHLIRYHERKLNAIDLPDWWNGLAGVLETVSPFRFLLALVKGTLGAVSPTAGSFTLGSFEIGIGTKTIEIPIRLRDRSEPFEIDSAVDPVLSKVRFLLREKRMSSVRMLGSEIPAAA